LSKQVDGSAHEQIAAVLSEVVVSTERTMVQCRLGRAACTDAATFDAGIPIDGASIESHVSTVIDGAATFSGCAILYDGIIQHYDPAVGNSASVAGLPFWMMKRSTGDIHTAVHGNAPPRILTIHDRHARLPQ